MPELQRLRLDHADALLAFELENRDYFAESIPDRGDAYFAEFGERLRGLIAEQEAGLCHFHVLVNDDGSVVGRINLVDVADGQAELGYRIAKKASGQGVATAAVREICSLAVSYGLRTLIAETTAGNVGSQAVLKKAGFVQTGEKSFDGRPGLTFKREL